MSLTRRITLTATLLSLAMFVFVVVASSNAWLPAVKSHLGFSSDAIHTSTEPYGTLIITGVKLNSVGIESLPQNYAWDIVNPSSGWERLGDISRGTVFSAFLEPTNLERPLSVFLRAMVLEENGSTLSEQIARVDLSHEQTSFLAIDIKENPKQFTWSEAVGLLAYQGEGLLTSSSTGLIEPSVFVRVFDPVTEKALLTVDDAMQPFWSPDGTRLVYLKDNGVYYYDLQNNREVLVMGVRDYDPSSRYVDANTKIGLSPDGRYLAWTSPSGHVLYVFEIKNWEEPVESETVQIIRTENTSFYWPTFSPDNKMVSVQAIDTDPITGLRTNPRLQIYAIGSLNLVTSVPLSEFDFDRLFTDTWVGVSLQDLNLQGYFGRPWYVSTSDMSRE